MTNNAVYEILMILQSVEVLEMKKVLSIIITFILVLGSISAFATEEKGVMLNIDGTAKRLIAYNIGGNNYFKLRDVAIALKGTSAQFDVNHNANLDAVEITTNTAYSQEGTLTEEMLSNPIAYTTSMPIYKDGVEVLMSAYNIGGNNYFKLRDIAACLDFNVEWDDSAKIIVITTNESYVYPPVDPSSLSVNPDYVSYISKTKAETDKNFGSSTYSMEYGTSEYDNGITIGWNTIGTTPNETSTPICIFIPLDKFFYNCPDVLTVDMIKSFFPFYEEGIDEMEGGSYICVNYCGKIITFETDRPITKNTSVFLNLANRFSFIRTDSFQVNTDIQNLQPVAPSEFMGTKTEYSTYRNLIKENRQNFISYNDFDIWEHECYYVHADFDRDGKKELAVRLGFGIAIYKEREDGVYLLYSNPIDADNYASYMGDDYQVVVESGNYYFVYGENYMHYNSGVLEKVDKSSFQTRPSYVDYLSPDELAF